MYQRIAGHLLLHLLTLEVAHGTNPPGGNVQLSSPPTIPTVHTPPNGSLDHVIINQGLNQLPYLVQTKLDPTNIGLPHLIHDLPQANSPPTIEPPDAVHDEMSQLGYELMIKFQFGIPRSAGNFLGGHQIVEHVKLLGLGGDALGGFDESASSPTP